jgi:hypothetical protein
MQKLREIESGYSLRQKASRMTFKRFAAQGVGRGHVDTKHKTVDFEYEGSVPTDIANVSVFLKLQGKLSEATPEHSIGTKTFRYKGHIIGSDAIFPVSTVEDEKMLADALADPGRVDEIVTNWGNKIAEYYAKNAALNLTDFGEGEEAVESISQKFNIPAEFVKELAAAINKTVSSKMQKLREIESGIQWFKKQADVNPAIEQYKAKGQDGGLKWKVTKDGFPGKVTPGTAEEKDAATKKYKDPGVKEKLGFGTSFQPKEVKTPITEDAKVGEQFKDPGEVEKLLFKPKQFKTEPNQPKSDVDPAKYLGKYEITKPMQKQFSYIGVNWFKKAVETPKEGNKKQSAVELIGVLTKFAKECPTCFDKLVTVIKRKADPDPGKKPWSAEKFEECVEKVMKNSKVSREDANAICGKQMWESASLNSKADVSLDINALPPEQKAAVEAVQKLTNIDDTRKQELIQNILSPKAALRKKADIEECVEAMLKSEKLVANEGETPEQAARRICEEQSK